MKTRIAQPSDLPGILQLQKANLFSVLNKEERRMGFVTTPFTKKQILEIMTLDGLFVAEANDQIIAYVFAGKWDYFEQWPIFPLMTARFPVLSFNGSAIKVENSFQYGPICIERNYRGNNLMSLIFEEMRLVWLEKFSLSITFINQINKISTRAHEKLGWEVIDKFEFNDNRYLVLAFDMQRSALS